MSRLLIKNAKALLGVHPAGRTRVAGADMVTLPTIADAWLTAEDGLITGFGPMAEWSGISDWTDLMVIDATGRYVLPGWCDPHTHTVFAAPREGEFVDRIEGATYQEIAARGGGIINSALKLRAMDEDTLFALAETRLRGMMRQGTVAVEIKSGYGLDLESELKMLRVVRRLKDALPLRIKATLLAAHALPPEFANDRAGYLDLVCGDLVPRVAEEGLADFVDVFCEKGYFTVDELLRVLEAGTRHGLRGKVHVDQFNAIGGGRAAVEHGALSVDHLEVVDDDGIAALAAAAGATLPTLLPACSFFLGIPYAPARRLIDAGLPVALATDHNPGSAPSGDMNLVLTLACVALRMLPEEAINAMTLNAAAAMGLEGELGSIATGKRASLLITREIPSPAYLPYAFGEDHIDTVLIDGEPVRSGEALA